MRAEKLLEATKALDVADLDALRRTFTATLKSMGGGLTGRGQMYQDSVRMLSSATKEYQSAINRLVARTRSGSMGANEAVAAFKATLDDVYKRAYMSGALRAGNPYYKEIGLTQSDEGIARSAGRVETGFWKSFVGDIQDKTYPASRIDLRALMYGKALESQHWNGYIAGLGPDVKIAWILGAPETDHCSDCEEIAANSPYTPATLPTTPKSGDTDCLSNCYCMLMELATPDDLVRGFAPQPVAITPDEVHGLNPAEVTGPNGLPAPESISEKFQDLYSEVNRLRQLMEVDVENLDTYIEQRKELIKAISALEHTFGVRVTPRYSVKDLTSTVKSLVDRGWTWSGESAKFREGDMVRRVVNTSVRSGLVRAITGTVVTLDTTQGLNIGSLLDSMYFWME